MNFLELVKARYSARKYANRPVEAEKLDYIMECVRFAPSAVNFQPWRFRIVTDEVLDDGFEFVQMGRALLNEPGFVNRLRTEEKARCNCGHSNYCIARMYTIDMACHKHLEEKLPLCLEREIEKLENQ
jgi:nitroreductase